MKVSATFKIHFKQASNSRRYLNRPFTAFGWFGLLGAPCIMHFQFFSFLLPLLFSPLPFLSSLPLSNLKSHQQDKTRLTLEQHSWLLAVDFLCRVSSWNRNSKTSFLWKLICCSRFQNSDFLFKCSWPYISRHYDLNWMFQASLKSQHFAPLDIIIWFL